MPVAPTTAETLRRRAWFMLQPGVARASTAPRALRRAWLARGWRPEHGAATGGDATAAGEYHIDIRRIIRFPLDLIIVGQLFTGRDVADRLDEHAAVLNHRFAIRIAAVIDKARFVAPDTGVDDGAAIDDEEKRMVIVLVLLV